MTFASYSRRRTSVAHKWRNYIKQGQIPQSKCNNILDLDIRFWYFAANQGVNHGE
jgi:hypothetical protein